MDHADIKYWLDQGKKFEPELGIGQITVLWREIAEDIVCVLDYTPEERGTRDEPGNLADATLRQAFVRDVDIYDLLSQKQITRVEEQAIREMEARIKEAANERALSMAGLA